MAWHWTKRDLGDACTMVEAVRGALWARAWEDRGSGPWRFIVCEGTFDHYFVLGTGRSESEEEARRSAEAFAETLETRP